MRSRKVTTTWVTLAMISVALLLGAGSCKSKWAQANAGPAGPSIMVRIGMHWENGKKYARWTAYTAAALLGAAAAHHVFSKDPCLLRLASSKVAKFPDAKGAVNTVYLTCGMLTELNKRGGDYYNDGWVISCIGTVTAAVNPVATGSTKQKWKTSDGRHVTALLAGEVTGAGCH